MVRPRRPDRPIPAAFRVYGLRVLPGF